MTSYTGRQRRFPPGTETSRIQIRVNLEEESRIMFLANERNISVAELLVQAVLAPETGVTEGELGRLYRLLDGLYDALPRAAQHLRDVHAQMVAFGHMDAPLAARHDALLNDLRANVDRTGDALDANIEVTNLVRKITRKALR